jgi:hypothetical protein
VRVLDPDTMAGPVAEETAGTGSVDAFQPVLPMPENDERVSVMIELACDKVYVT